MSVTDFTDEPNDTESTKPENRPLSGGRDPSTGKFIKGKSGNDGGRPKMEVRVRELAQKHSPAAIKRLAELMYSENERVAVAACDALLDRGIGKPRQAVEISTDPERPPPQFGISFALGGPGNPLSPEEQNAAALPRTSEPDGVEVSGDMGDPGDFEADVTPLSLPQPNSSTPWVEPPRVIPDPARPEAVVIDQHDGAVWASLMSAAAGVSMPEPSETRAHSARSREALEARQREHAERNERERQAAREAAKVREQKMRERGE
jgi:hypothetical protein